MSEHGKPIHIEPVDFRAHPGRKGPGRRARRLKNLWVVLGMGLLLAGAGLVWLVLTGPTVSIRIDPSPDAMELRGGFYRIPIGDEFLVWPGRYRVQARKSGYVILDHEFEVSGGNVNLELSLDELPGLLTVSAQSVRGEDVAEARVFCDETELGMVPVQQYPLPGGPVRLDVRAERYLDGGTNVLIQGEGQEQVVVVPLVPAWGDVRINAAPQTAILQVNGASQGGMPVDLELMAGNYEIRLEEDGYKPFVTQLVVEANARLDLGVLNLAESDAVLLLTSTPTGALVTVDGQFAGMTPVTANVTPNVTHRVRFSTAGHDPVDREIRLAPMETNKLEVALTPILAKIRFMVEPDGTELVVDGIPVGPTPSSMDLTTEEHRLELRKEGFVSHIVIVRPKTGIPQEVKVTLAPVPPVIHAKKVEGSPVKAGSDAVLPPRLVRIAPVGTFRMGASRREQGRRSNETLRKVQLTRPYLIGTHEVTNEEFMRFTSKHHSGSVRQLTLNRAEQPVANVTWADAAAYCNWLSEQQGLEPVYERDGSRTISKAPIPNGFRLPTEAEWAYAARVVEGDTLLRYPWGHGFPPPSGVGNFADESVRRVMVKNLLKGYNDGVPLTAKPGSFPPNHRGLFDMGGNVGEWCHDRYRDYPIDIHKVEKDPVGPQTGRFYTIRGSSWRSAGITTLRYSYRGYSEEERDDVGFRVCRYDD